MLKEEAHISGTIIHTFLLEMRASNIIINGNKDIEILVS
jgi:hypothetical protein